MKTTLPSLAVTAYLLFHTHTHRRAHLSENNTDIPISELTVEAAWENCQSKLKEAKTAAERRKIRRKEMHAVNTTSETAYTQEAQEVLDGRIRLLEWKQELGEWEEKYWFSRL